MDLSKLIGGIAALLAVCAVLYPHIVPDPIVPSNPCPGDGEDHAAMNLHLSWYGGDPWNDSVEYVVCIGTSREYLPPSDDRNGYFSGSGPFDYELNDLQENTTYYWKVVAENQEGKKAESPIWTFTTSEYGSPNQPSNPNPSDGQQIIGRDVALSWNCGDQNRYAVTYSIYLGTKKDQLHFINSISPLLGSESCSYNYNNLDPGKTYYWQIIAKNDKRKQIPGPIWTFSTRSLPKIVTFKTNSSLSKSDRPARLEWNVTGAQTVEIEPDIGIVSSKGYREVYPQTTTEYVLSAKNAAGGSIPKKIKIWTPPEIVISCDKTNVNSGESIQLNWKVSNADSATLNGRSVELSSSIQEIVTKTTYYIISAKNAMWTSSMLRIVTVNDNNLYNDIMLAIPIVNSQTGPNNYIWFNNLLGIKQNEAITVIHTPIGLSLHLDTSGSVNICFYCHQINTNVILQNCNSYSISSPTNIPVISTFNAPSVGVYELWCTIADSNGIYSTNTIKLHVYQ